MIREFDCNLYTINPYLILIRDIRVILTIDKEIKIFGYDFFFISIFKDILFVICKFFFF